MMSVMRGLYTNAEDMQFQDAILAQDATIQSDPALGTVDDTLYYYISIYVVRRPINFYRFIRICYQIAAPNLTEIAKYRKSRIGR